MTIEETIAKRTKEEAWRDLGDYAADLAMKMQATHGAPRRFIEAAHKILEMHRQLRPEMYGPRATKSRSLGAPRAAHQESLERKTLTQDDLDQAAEEATKRKSRE